MTHACGKVPRPCRRFCLKSALCGASGQWCGSGDNDDQPGQLLSGQCGSSRAASWPAVGHIDARITGCQWDLWQPAGVHRPHRQSQGWLPDRRTPGYIHSGGLGKLAVTAAMAGQPRISTWHPRRIIIRCMPTLMGTATMHRRMPAARSKLSRAQLGCAGVKDQTVHPARVPSSPPP